MYQNIFIETISFLIINKLIFFIKTGNYILLNVYRSQTYVLYV